ncbi:alpha/beta fold hydrolase [Hymenobacter coccineus]|uniref:AB hydrolase-1 domain-containing protein n=1 Tax=Hymenobacter coccineus TaxID=1908235 RepID=A0A1G1TJ48_9BACT|nr:alpha/beta hydrolase [Hymenobacter coccineus]OGX90896.1 hypothetical protein BEN49_05945 [Hymenobacter coccineus]
MHPSEIARAGAPGQPALVADPAFRVDSVASKDGTKIGYRIYGQGPGLLIVQGAMGIATNYDQLARAIAPYFTVYLPDRRGRGMSPRPFTADHTVARDVEDVQSVVEKTGTHWLFGLSSGAIIALEATRVLPAIHQTVLYEPPFYVDGVPVKNIARLNQEIAAGQLNAALVSIFRTTRVGPPIFNVLPRFALLPLTSAFLKAEARKTPGQYAPIPTLISSTRYDFQVVLDRGGAVQSYRSVEQPILLLGGSKSPAYLKKALATLATTLPHARRVELPGLDHAGPWNADLGGQPTVVAEQLRQFFQPQP